VFTASYPCNYKLPSLGLYVFADPTIPISGAVSTLPPPDEGTPTLTIWGFCCRPDSIRVIQVYLRVRVTRDDLRPSVGKAGQRKRVLKGRCPQRAHGQLLKIGCP